MLNDKNYMMEDLPSLERAKLKVECERIKIEWIKTKWIIIAILVPLLTTAITIFVGVINYERQARKDFEIKAVEIVMNTPSPRAALNKARVLASMFPDRLPANFVQSLEKLYGDNPLQEK